MTRTFVYFVPADEFDVEDALTSKRKRYHQLFSLGNDLCSARPRSMFCLVFLNVSDLGVGSQDVKLHHVMENLLYNSTNGKVGRKIVIDDVVSFYK